MGLENHGWNELLCYNLPTCTWASHAWIFFQKRSLLQTGALNPSWDIRLGSPWAETNISRMCPLGALNTETFAARSHSALEQALNVNWGEFSLWRVQSPKIEHVWSCYKSACTFLSSFHSRRSSCVQDMVAKAASQSLCSQRQGVCKHYMI